MSNYLSVALKNSGRVIENSTGFEFSRAGRLKEYFTILDYVGFKIF